MYFCPPSLSISHWNNKAGYYIGIKRQFIYLSSPLVLTPYLSSPPVLTPLSRTHSYNHWCKTQHQLITHTHTRTHLKASLWNRTPAGPYAATHTHTNPLFWGSCITAISSWTHWNTSQSLNTQDISCATAWQVPCGSHKSIEPPDPSPDLFYHWSLAVWFSGLYAGRFLPVGTATQSHSCSLHLEDL